MDALAVFEEELVRTEETRASGDVAKILELFPSKRIAGVVAKALAVKDVKALFALLSGSLMAVDADDPLSGLGKDLEEQLNAIGLPPRTIAERYQEQGARAPVPTTT